MTDAYGGGVGRCYVDFLVHIPLHNFQVTTVKHRGTTRWILIRLFRLILHLNPTEIPESETSVLLLVVVVAMYIM